MATMRSAPKNMCSVRQRPMPSAPNERAARASAGVSALARTAIRRAASAHSIRRAKSPESSGWRIGDRAGKHLAGGAVDGDDLALLEDPAAGGERAAA